MFYSGFEANPLCPVEPMISTYLTVELVKWSHGRRKRIEEENRWNNS
jgi:hypothetical protein